MIVLPSQDGEPTCHCGRLAEDGDTICGQCVVRRFQSLDDTCCRDLTWDRAKDRRDGAMHIEIVVSDPDLGVIAEATTADGHRGYGVDS